jgi:hypothetical protein
MAQPEQAAKTKNIKSFWAIVVILVIAILAGGLIYWFQFQYTYDQNINSLEFRFTARHNDEQKSLPAKTVKSGTSTPAATKK